MSPTTDGEPTQGRATPSAKDRSEQAAEIDDEEVFDVLKNGRRRAALEYLADTDCDEVPISILAEQVAATENGTTPEELSADERKRVYVSLHQCHLPKLDDLDIVAYDEEETTVRPGPNASHVAPYMGDRSMDGQRWHRYCGYLALGGTVLALLNRGLLGLPGDVVTVLILSVLAACSLVGWMRHRAAVGTADTFS